MHLRIRDSAYFDRRLQLSNSDRSSLVAKVTAQLSKQWEQNVTSSVVRATDSDQRDHHCEVSDVTEHRTDSSTFETSWSRHKQLHDVDGRHMNGSPSSQRSHNAEMDQLLVTSASTLLPVVEMERQVHDGGESVTSSTASGMWNRRSIATPQRNYSSIARRHRAASAFDSTNNGNESMPSDGMSQDRYRPGSTTSSFSFSGGGRSTPSPTHRVLLIKLQAGTGGLDPLLHEERTTFGVGTAGLGALRCEDVTQHVRDRQREEWGAARDKWAHEDHQRDAVRLKKWSASSRIKSVPEMRNMKYEIEARKSELAKETKDEAKSLATQAQVAREDLTRLEHETVRERRQNELGVSVRRRENNEHHAAALQHLGRLENASRKLDSMNEMEENAAKTRRLQRQNAAARITSAAQRDSARDQIHEHRRQLAAQLRASEIAWEKRAKVKAKMEADEAKVFVKKLHESIQAGPRNAKAVLEYRNSQRHASLKKAHEALEALMLERREKAVNAAREIAEAQRDAERQRREASPLRHARERSSSFSSDDDGGNSC
jgi:hypothetical protein